MKKQVLTILGIALMSTLTLTSCSKDDGGNTPDPDPTEFRVSENITADTTWETGKTYELAGRIAVTNGATLTIQPGVVIKGQAGAGANATALLVSQNGTLMAEGTASLPIIFTSVSDEITPAQVASGNFASPNLNADVNGLWGGVIILGEAPISASTVPAQIEGIPQSDASGQYGGEVATDNSGVIKYVSIRHGGANIGEGNEINGLTLGGVGSGTTIENIEVVGNQDDGIEFFGGSVNVSNVVVLNCYDDGLDTDQGFYGSVDNFAVIATAGHAFELDGPEGEAYFGNHNLNNGYVVMSNNVNTTKNIINTDANSNAVLSDIFVKGLTNNSDQIINRLDGDNIFFSNIYLDTTPEDLVNRIPEGATVPAWLMAGTTNTFNASPLSWTWASQAGALE